MKIIENGVYRDMTEEEIEGMQSPVDEKPTDNIVAELLARIEALESNRG